MLTNYSSVISLSFALMLTVMLLGGGAGGKLARNKKLCDYHNNFSDNISNFH